MLQACVTLPVQAATRYEVGVATSATLLRMNDADLHERLNDIRQLGAHWIRVDFSWRVIQPESSREYDWALYDRLVREANDHDLKILAIINYTPAWARNMECAELVKEEEFAQKCIPRSNGEFASFASVLANRYKDTNVRAWEIWNEPNLTGHWKMARRGTIAVDPEAYAHMANVAAYQIRHNYPDSVIITGGLAPLFEPDVSTGMRQSDYLETLLPNLKLELFDGIAIHPYSWPAMPSKAATYNSFYNVDNGKPHINLRSIMDRAGWSEKEIWGTEYGASTKGQRAIGIPCVKARPDHVTETVQAQIVTQGIEDWYDKTNVGPLFVHSDSDRWLVSYKNEGGFGLRRSDGTKKPSYDALQRATQYIDTLYRH
jgi:hypothetical protein